MDNYIVLVCDKCGYAEDTKPVGVDGYMNALRQPGGVCSECGHSRFRWVIQYND